MACIDAPVPPFPTLPGGLTLGPGIPTPSFNVAYCCKLLEFNPAPIPPFALSGPLLAAASAVLAAQHALLEAYFDLIPVVCPREAGP
jgi:hypothetical protein